MNKKLLLIPTAAVSAALAAGSIAYACTTVTGTMTITKLGSASATCNTQNNPQTDPNCDIGINVSREVVAYGSNARPNTDFYMWFLNRAADQDSMQICMAGTGAKHPSAKMHSNSTGTVGGVVRSDGSGNVASTTRHIPATVTHGSLYPLEGTHGTHNGTASICWMDNGKSYATEDVTILITGGNGNP